ncbi:protein translocase subunit SecF [Litorihabitans aurantiacus]|uniref:Protein-export membrane protein SecF n=1 Tax=Litorihabitans aurantiacus TaxID=1930061 RepID=A0AA38CSZ6_9MICO|nr:protein translocase subunit SecF [Litorihabitans aurantiacus]GMA31377.1 protein-export membrane protein SecF [Litorihabitans aurantiacus]
MAGQFARLGNDLYTGKRSYDIVGKRRVWFIAAAVLVIVSGLLLAVRGLNVGIEFRGGSEFTVSGAATTSSDPANEVLGEIGTDQVARVSVVGGDSVRIQTDQLTQEQTDQVAASLAEVYEVERNAVTSSFIGPTWGADITAKALQGLVIFIVLVALVMALYFRTWSMAAAALIALIHDLIVTVGLYAGIGFEVTPASVIGLLTILGYSLYDTVVVFDKVRENTANVLEQTRVTYEEASNLAVNQTIVRSINTSVVGVLPVASILFVGAFLLGAGTLRDIALSLFIGMIVSTASSIFLATPLEAALRMRRSVYREHSAKVLALRAEVGETETVVTSADVRPETDRVAATVPGVHLGTQSQPRRKR